MCHTDTVRRARRDHAGGRPARRSPRGTARVGYAGPRSTRAGGPAPSPARPRRSLNWSARCAGPPRSDALRRGDGRLLAARPRPYKCIKVPHTAQRECRKRSGEGPCCGGRRGWPARRGRHGLFRSFGVDNLAILKVVPVRSSGRRGVSSQSSSAAGDLCPLRAPGSGCILRARSLGVVSLTPPLPAVRPLPAGPLPDDPCP